MHDTSHIVQIFDREAALCESLPAYVRSALTAGDGFVLIARCERLHVFIDRLLQTGVDVEGLVSSGSLLLLDARELLVRGQRQGEFDVKIFSTVAEEIFRTMRESHSKVRAYSEMADHLIELGRLEQAVALESFCEQLCLHQPVSVLCSYDRTWMHEPKESPRLNRLVHLHTHVIDGDETLAALLKEQSNSTSDLFQTKEN